MGGVKIKCMERTWHLIVDGGVYVRIDLISRIDDIDNPLDSDYATLSSMPNLNTIEIAGEQHFTAYWF